MNILIFNTYHILTMNLHFFTISQFPELVVALSIELKDILMELPEALPVRYCKQGGSTGFCLGVNYCLNVQTHCAGTLI